MSRTPLELLALALDQTGELVAGVRDDQWENATPCTEWSVRDLVDHLIGGNDGFANVLLGDPPPSFSGVTARQPEAQTAYRLSTESLLTAFGSDGVMERVVTVRFGTVPGIAALHLRSVEAVVHGWDLAQATGQPLRVDEELARQELEFTRTSLPDITPERSPFGPAQPVPGDASSLDQLVALLGRTVNAEKRS